MQTIREPHAEYLFLRALQLVKIGRMVAPRKKTTLEVQTPVCLTLTNPDNCGIVTNPYRKLNYAFGLAEALQIWAGDNSLERLIPYNSSIANFSDDGKTLSGSYGPPFIMQLPYILRVLREDRDSRQAVLTIWHRNPVRSKDIPCTVMMHFLIRDFQLHLNVYMRSNDVWLGFPYDIFTFTTFQKQVAQMLGTTVGYYNHIVGSLHGYAGDVAKFEFALKYAGAEVRLPSILSDCLSSLVSYETDTRRSFIRERFDEPKSFYELHANLIHAYWAKKRKVKGAEDLFPDPYRTLRSDAREVRAKFKDSKD